MSWDGCRTQRVFSDKVQRLLVMLSYFWPDRFVQLRSLIPILILLLYLLVSIDLEYTGLLVDTSAGFCTTEILYKYELRLTIIFK